MVFADIWPGMESVIQTVTIVFNARTLMVVLADMG